MPALLLFVPEHPEVAQQDHRSRDQAHDPPNERADVADRAAGVEADHPDPESHLPQGLAALGTDERREVDGADEEPEAGADSRPHDRLEDSARDPDDDPVDEGAREAAPESCASPTQDARPAVCARLHASTMDVGSDVLRVVPSHLDALHQRRMVLEEDVVPPGRARIVQGLRPEQPEELPARSWIVGRA